MSFTSRIAAAAARGYGMFRIAAAAAVDPFFNYVTALLHGDGTNGAQNNTFLDSSTNNFTITRNGNTTQGTFSPFSQTGWSNYFDGSTAYLSVPANVAFQFGTGDFTIEFWAYTTSTSRQIIFGNYSSSGVTYGWAVQVNVNSTGDLFFGWGNATISNPSNVWSANQWNHVAIARSGTTTKLFVNGAQASSVTDNTNYNNGNNVVIGRNADLAQTAYWYSGYVSNARVVKGTAVYTAAFTPPTTPLTAITNTQLLTCQSNRFLDTSSNAFTVTATGSPSVQAFSPFNPTSAWSASSNGGSGYFDGSGDYLSIAYNSALDLGGSDFTVEGWVYSTNNGSALLNVIDFGWQFGVYGPLFVANTSGTLLFYASSNGSSWDIANATTIGVLPLNSWNHFAISRNGTSIRVFFNGALVTTITTSAALMSNASRAITIGGDTTGAYNFGGYISGLRVVKGSSVYNAAFSVPTAPPTAVTNTQLLTNFTNAGIYDNAAVADYETLGNAQVSTSVVKYGTGSMYFDGTGDYLSGPTNANFAFGTGDFTVEGWVYFNSVSGVPTIYSSGTYNTSQFTLRVASSKFQFYGGNGATLLVSGNTTLTTGVWYHFAVCRIAGVTKLFVNGNTDVTEATAFTYSPTGSFSVGETIGNTGQLNGYIDDLRITKGVGRYQYNFTPPAAAFPNIGGTVTLTADPYFKNTTLLLPGNGTNGAQNNTFLDSSSNAFTITRNGNTTQGNFSPFSQTGWSAYFDGAATTRLTVPSNTAFNYGTGDFTIEFWVYVTSWSAGSMEWLDTNTTGGFTFYANATTIRCAAAGTAAFLTPSTSGLANNAWYHVAFVRSGTTNTVYLNGTSIGSATNSTNYPTQDLVIGGWATGTYTPMYLSNLRIVKGTAVYASNFTPSTTPLTAISGTSLLTIQSNRFIDNSSNAFTITPVNTVSIQAFSPFAPTAAWSASTNGGSGYFDGSGDYLDIASTAALTPSGDFTIEFWAYPTTNAGIREWYSKGLGIQVYSNGAAWYAALSASNSGTYYINTTFGTLLANTWQHVVVTRSGNSYVGFVNGVSSSLATTSSSPSTGTDPVRIGDLSVSAVYPVLGYMSGVRYVNGTAVYGTSNFTPPTAPLTAIANTQLLLNYTNGGIVDATAKNDLETVGNAQISTTQSKFGGSSMYFDGTGDYLNIPNSPLLQLGGGDWTIECWVYLASTSGTQRVISQSDSNYQFAFYLSSGALTAYSFQSSGTQNFAISMGTLSASTWYHIAVTRYGNSVKAFVNGIQAGSTATLSTTIDARTGGWKLGAAYNGSENLNGYVQGARITLGIARYTSNFTPPTSAFLLQ